MQKLIFRNCAVKYRRNCYAMSNNVRVIFHFCLFTTNKYSKIQFWNSLIKILLILLSTTDIFHKLLKLTSVYIFHILNILFKKFSVISHTPFKLCVIFYTKLILFVSHLPMLRFFQINKNSLYLKLI